MSLSVLIILLAILITVVLLVTFVTAGVRLNNAEQQAISPGDFDWSALSDESVTQYYPNQKIRAIKAYRQLTNAGLGEAKMAVEYALAHPEMLDSKKARSAEQSLSDAGIRELVEDGRLDEATELYRQFTGVDEYTARDYVEHIDEQLRGQSG